MTAALDIINRAYSLIGFKAAGEAISGDDAEYALDALNAMVDGWNTQTNFLTDIKEVVASVTGISASIGVGLAFNTVRPTMISEGCFSRLNGVDYPLTQISREEYNAIGVKAITGSFPQYFFYDADLRAPTVYFFPVPVAAVEVHLQCGQYLAEFADLSTDYLIAPGYRKALQYSLAEELAPGVKQLDPLIVRNAANARRAIRRTNVNVPLLDLGFSRVGFSMYAGFAGGGGASGAPTPAPAPAPAPAPSPGASTAPRFANGPANPTGDAATFASFFASAALLTGSVTGGHTGSFNTSADPAKFAWLFVLRSAAPAGIHISDGTGTGGFSGATSPNLFAGSDADPTTVSLPYIDGSGNVWDAYRSNGKAKNFATYTLS